MAISSEQLAFVMLLCVGPASQKEVGKFEGRRVLQMENVSLMSKQD